MKVRDVLRILAENGWMEVACKGSHRQLKHVEKPGKVTVPGNMSDDLRPGTLASIFRQVELEKPR